jgi:Domain of unknown function (DUF3854)
MLKNCIRSCDSTLESQPVLQQFSDQNCQSLSSGFADRSEVDGNSSIVGRQIASDHEQEWRASGVDVMIARLNVQTLVDTVVDNCTHEVVYPIAERLNWNVIRFGPESRPHLRGWWVSGVDPLDNWQAMSWGRFKPDAATPVMDPAKGKAAKYLSPSLGKGSSRLVLLDVPLRIWQRVAARYNLPIDRTNVRNGFWYWVLKSGVPIVLTEGEKKAGALLTAGYAAIALPGIFGGHRRETNQLIPELAMFATPGRTFQICFDYETKPQTVKSVVLATAKLGQLLTRADCPVQIVSLPGEEKGVDDFWVARGQVALDELFQTAQEWSLWQAAQLWALTAVPDLSLNQPYLGELAHPDRGLVFVKSPKGTGKTTALQPVIQRAIGQDRKILVITHRIQLGKSICHSLGIDWIETIGQSEGQDFRGYGLCVDSLHAKSQARFDPYAWAGAVVILDEVEQVLWHALNSATCAHQRVAILAALRELVQFVLQTGGLVIAQDADLSDVSVNYLKTLAAGLNATETIACDVPTWLAVNQWQQPKALPIGLYDTKNPAALIAKMEAVIATGPVFVAMDSQKFKGRWSSKNLESYLAQRFPDKRILRIDSESVADADHPACSIANRINEIIGDYDIVLATPTIGTGVSIDLKGHFKAVFGMFQGVISDSEARQALARVRDNVPRYVWAARFGPGKIGNGSCFYRDIAQSTAKVVKYNIMLLKEVDFDLDQQTDPVALRTWAKMAARVNVSLWNFRNELRNGFLREGYAITVITDDPVKLLGQAELTLAQHHDLATGELQVPGYEFLERHHDLAQIERVNARMTRVRSANQKAEALAVSGSPELSAAEYDELREQRTQTRLQRQSQRKHELKNLYPVNITPELMLKDEQGWYSQLRLHYYLTHDPLFVQLRDRQEWQAHLDRGNGKVALQDVRLMTAQVEMLKAMGLVDLLDADRKTRVTDAEIQAMAQLAQVHRSDLRLLFNIRITDKTTPMTFIQALLAKMDLRLACTSRDRAPDGRRAGLRVYRYIPPADRRSDIFDEWRQQDEMLLSEKNRVNTGIDRIVA